MDIWVRHEGGDRYLIEVGGHGVVVDQPETGDSGPTPTDLFVGSLAACTAHYAGRFFARHGLDAEGFGLACTFEMATDRPSRVGSITLRLELPQAFPEDLRERLLAVIEHCTVHNSIVVPPATRFELVAPKRAA